MFVKFLICLLAITVQCSCMLYNESARYVKMERAAFRNKGQKWLHFHTDDKDEVAIELAFNVPFIAIPIKKTLDMAKGMVNINIGAVLLAGVMIIGTGIAGPAIYHLFAQKLSPTLKSRSEQHDEIWSDLSTKLNEAFAHNNLDSIACTQRICCWLVKNSSGKVSKGIGSSHDKIIDGIATNEWLQAMLQDSIFHGAIQHGLRGSNCSREYANCKINQSAIHKFINDFVKQIYR